MIHVVTARNRCVYAQALSEMHRLRKVHFADERGWTAMRIRDGGEYDAYDDDHAVYLLAIEPDGSISGSMRMRPAQFGSILADVFPHLIAGSEPAIDRPEVWEISRFFTIGATRGLRGFQRRAELRLAALEVALAREVEHLVGMIDIEVLPMVLNGSGWRVRLLGLPAPYDEGVVQAVDIQVSRDALLDMEDSQGLESPMSLMLGPDQAPLLAPHELEVLIGSQRLDGDARQVLVSVVRRVVELQDQLPTAQLVGMVEYVETVLTRGAVALA